MIKTFYHGTVQAFLPDIKKHGLLPTAKHSWKVKFDHWGELVSNPDVNGEGVYLAKSKEHAESYAQTKADYFQRNPGECFEMYQTKKSAAEGNYLFLQKEKSAPVLHTVPMLLTIQFDDEQYSVEEDPEDIDYSFICKSPLPPSVIVEITKLAPKYDDSTFDKAKRKKIVDAAMDRMFGDNSAMRDLISSIGGPNELHAAAVKKGKKDARN